VDPTKVLKGPYLGIKLALTLTLAFLKESDYPGTKVQSLSKSKLY
jgi:hypothetical protein